ncbi:MAG: peptidoglycan bridge formation glycyltransferase FemA/FemB family protein [Candidatus Harrisonbacteria bacterium]|nr:peptidoglycan bridge formation glycyltransferase FemA/FemB family protein [Candidatus Harrisonbacteria bacterium]
MEIKAIDSKQQWEDFIKAQDYRSFLQSWNWGELEKDQSRKIWRLGFFSSGSLQALGLIVKIKARRGVFLFCPHGPVISPEADVKEVLSELTKKLKEIGKEERCDFIRLSPLMEESQEHENLFLTLGFRQAPVHMMHPELSWMLELEKSEEELLAGMRKTSRYCVRKAQKDGIKVSMSKDIRDLDHFLSVYTITAQRQGFVPFSKDHLEKELKSFFSSDQGALFLARYRQEVVAASIVIFYGNSAFYHHGASTQKYEGLNTSYALQWEAIKEAKKRGLRFYNFWGVVPKDLKGHPWQGISLFKRGFGGFEQAYVHAKDYPLTKKYYLNWIVETLRRKRRGY